MTQSDPRGSGPACGPHCGALRQTCRQTYRRTYAGARPPRTNPPTSVAMKDCGGRPFIKVTTLARSIGTRRGFLWLLITRKTS